MSGPDATRGSFRGGTLPRAARLLTFAILVTAPASTHATSARPYTPDPRPRTIVLDIRGPAEEATTLRTTLQELTAGRGLPFVFETFAADRGSRNSAAPWATLSVELEGGGPRSRADDGQPGFGAALTLREGAVGRLRLHRFVPSGASHAVTIETLATIAYTALETLAREETAHPIVRPTTGPRERGEPGPAPEHAEPSPAEPEAMPAPLPGARPEPLSAPATTAPLPAALSTSPDTFLPTDAASDALTVASHSSAPLAVERVAPSHVRLSLASFGAYRAGNIVTGDRRAWGMGLGAAVAVPAWPLAPSLEVGLGAWSGPARESSVANDGTRPVSVPRLQGQAELRLTVVRQGRFSGALGPWLTVARAAYDSGPAAPIEPRPPQGTPPNSNVTASVGQSLVTRTEVSAGLTARLEAEFGGRFALYLAVAGAMPLTNRPFAIGGRPGPGSPSASGEIPSNTVGPPWTLSAFGGLSIALTGERRTF